MKSFIDNLKSPWVLILIGPPMSGKSYWIKQNFTSESNVVIISRDKIILDLHKSSDYDQAFREVDQKEVDRILLSQFQSASKNRENVIVDMTNLTRKRRMQNLSYFSSDYIKVAVIFPILSQSEYDSRNKKRKELENKTIPQNVLQNMISSYQTVDKASEGFDKSITI